MRITPLESAWKRLWLRHAGHPEAGTWPGHRTPKHSVLEAALRAIRNPGTVTLPNDLIA